MKISIKYIALFIVLFAIEVIIATYIHDNFIRPYLGDTIVIVLIYAFVMGFFSVGHTLSSKIKVAFYVLLFAFINGKRDSKLIDSSVYNVVCISIIFASYFVFEPLAWILALFYFFS